MMSLSIMLLLLREEENFTLLEETEKKELVF